MGKPSLLLALILELCISQVSHGKRKPEKYWKPSRIITSTAPINSPISTSESLALQRVIKSENQRIEKDPYLLQAVFHSSNLISRSALLALGRVGDPYSVETLSRVLNGKNINQKQLAAFSLGQIGDDLSIRLLSQHVAMERKADVRGAFYRAMGYSRQISALSMLARALETESDSVILKNIAEGFGILISGNSSTWIISEETLKRLVVLSQSQSAVGVSAAFALSQYKGDPQKLPTPQILTAIPKTPYPFAQALLIRALARVEDPQVTIFLLSKLSNTNPLPVRVEAAKSLKDRKLNDLALTVFQKVLNSEQNQVIIAALETIEENPEYFPSMTELVVNLFKNSDSNWVKSLALKTICRINPEVGRKLALETLKNSTPQLVSTALASLVLLNKTDDWNSLLPFFKQGAPQMVSQSIEALAHLKPEQITDDFKSTIKELVNKKDPGLLALMAQLASQKNWKDFAQPLADAYGSLKTEDTTETKVALIESLATLGSNSQIPVVNLALKDNSRQVILAAANTFKAISGKEPQIQIPLNTKVTDLIPDYSLWKPSTSKRVLLKTNRGEIEIKFFEDTPITAYRFIELIKTHFYDGKLFHRVVPNFVTQGGDPRGDGFGGAGSLIRDEVGPRNHERGTIGIATSGKDTGGCQFFFNLAPNYHLNGRYTVFAEVISGLDVMDKLEVGDRIISTLLR